MFVLNDTKHRRVTTPYDALDNVRKKNSDEMKLSKSLFQHQIASLTHAYIGKRQTAGKNLKNYIWYLVKVRFPKYTLSDVKGHLICA